MKHKHNALVWIDLEMTGLDYESDHILEIAALITDANLNIVAEGPNLIIHQPDQVLEKMNPWCIETHTASGLYQASQLSTMNAEQAEQQILNFIMQYCQKQNAPLCGNTVWFDKLFLKREMPLIVDFLHYRVVDVTSFKVMIGQWLGQDIVFKKLNKHRALDDIKESIAELKFYREQYMKV